ncbi:Uncharacterised protein [uncultured archaeon]|nr:Uncharacterised protein [uncultured archaeon]
MEKKLIEILAALFVAAIFFTSYAAFGGGGNTTTVSTTTTVSAQTFYATGSAQANVVSYGQLMNISISCANVSAVSGSINGFLSELETSGRVGNFYSPYGSEILVQAVNGTSYDVYNALVARMGQDAACSTFSSQVEVTLPAAVRLSVPLAKTTITLNLPASARNYALPVTLSGAALSAINVSIAALVTDSGALYGDLSVMRS